MAGFGAGGAQAGGFCHAKNGSSLTLGAMAVIKPKYEGSDEHEVCGMPLILPQFSDDPNSRFAAIRKRIRFKGLDDIRFNALGDATDSPVIETEDQLTGTIGLGYRFPINR